LWNTITHGCVWHGKVVDRRKGGSFSDMLAISPIRNEEGEITHFVGTHADFTGQENLERHETLIT